MKSALVAIILCSTAIAGDMPKPPYKAGDVRDDNALKMNLVWCPPGKYTTIGTKGRPSHVQIKAGFWIGKYEVTRTEWTSVMQTKPWEEWRIWKTEKGEVLPANGMFAEEWQEFAANLSELEQRAGRLQNGWEYTIPTREEWEYACRAGSTTDYCFGNNVGELNKYAWWGAHGQNAGNKTRLAAHGVGMKLPNKWGLHDTHGNLRELCASGTGKVRTHIACGGAWGDPERLLKCSSTDEFRAIKGSVDRDHARGQASSTGLRIVLTRVRKK